MTPNVVAVPAQAASMMLAPGATADDHSESIAASVSSATVKPGSAQPPGWVIESVPGYELRPASDRNVFQSAGLMSVCSATTSVTPAPMSAAPA